MKLQWLAPGMIVAVLIGIVAGAAVGAPHDDPPDAQSLASRALADNTALELAESLTTEIGARPAGSPAFARAKDWALTRLTALGFSNVHAELFTLDAWVRDFESASLVAPYPHRLVVLGYSGSPPTPPQGLE